MAWPPNPRRVALGSGTLGATWLAISQLLPYPIALLAGCSACFATLPCVFCHTVDPSTKQLHATHTRTNMPSRTPPATTCHPATPLQSGPCTTKSCTVRECPGSTTRSCSTRPNSRVLGPRPSATAGVTKGTQLVRDRRLRGQTRCLAGCGTKTVAAHFAGGSFPCYKPVHLPDEMVRFLSKCIGSL